MATRQRRVRVAPRPVAVAAYDTLYFKSFTETSLGSEWTNSFVGGTGTIDVTSYAMRLLTGATGAYADYARSILDARVNTADLRARFRFKLAQATSVYFGVDLRATSSWGASDNAVSFEMEGSGNTWSLGQSNVGAVSDLGSPVSRTWDTTNWFWVELEAVGTTLRGRVWRDDEQRPFNWQSEVTTAVTAAGRLRAWVSNGSTGLATRVDVDDFTVFQRCANETNYAARTHITPEANGYTAGGTAAAKQTALVAAFNACNDATKTVYLAPGVTYEHNHVLQLIYPGASISGTGTLHATAVTYDDKSALSFLAANQGAEDITCTAAGTTRAGNFNDHTINAFDAPNLILRDVKVGSGIGAGIFFSHIDNFRLYRPQVRGTLADAIHMTNCSQNGIIYDSWSEDNGDDGVAVVSYDTDDSELGVPGHNIDVYRPVVFRNTARGLTVAGGDDIRFFHAFVDTTNAAAIYFMVESGSYNVLPVSNSLVSYATLKRGNTDAATDHGFILIGEYHPTFTNTNTLIEHINMSDRPATTIANYYVRVYGSTTGCVLTDIHAQNVGPYPGNFIANESGATVTDATYV